MAAEPAATPAAQTGRCRAGQQDSPYGVGDDEERRDVPAPARRGWGGFRMIFRHVTLRSGPMPRPSIGDTPMTGAERQARYRAMHANGEPVIRIRRAVDRRSWIQRWYGPAGMGHDDAWKGSRLQPATD